jgi:hypothetical protein
VKAVEEGAVAMFTEDIRKSMRLDQSTLESRYANSTLLKKPKEMISIEYSRKKIKKFDEARSSFRYNDSPLHYIDFF